MKYDQSILKVFVAALKCFKKNPAVASWEQHQSHTLSRFRRYGSSGRSAC